MGTAKERSFAFKKRSIELLDQLEALINEMPYKGDTCEESQKMCLTNSLMDLSHCFNGVEISDFEEDGN